MRLLVGIFVLMLPLFATPIPVSVQLSWLHQFQFAGFYVAKELGYYEALDLNVSLKEAAPSTDVIQNVLSDTSDFGVGKSSLILARANHQPVIALMALFQHSPSVLISTDPEIQTPQNLKNKQIMMSPQAANSFALTSMLLAHGLSKDTYRLQPHSYRLSDLIERKTDAMACYLSNEPFTLQQQKIPYTIFDPRSYGFDVYGDILFTSKSYLSAHPNEAKQFYLATKKGWEWAFEHINETANIIFERYNTQHKSLDALIYEGEVLKELAFDRNKPYGILDPEKIQRIAHLYQLNGHLIPKVSLEGFIDPLHFAKDTIRIGILANREGDETIPTAWRASIEYLSELFPTHRFIIMPLEFKALEESVKNHEVAFVITNPIQYVQLEHKYGLSRLATMSTQYKGHYYSEYGSVIVTRANSSIRTFEDTKFRPMGAVYPTSLGGYLLGRKTLGENFKPSSMTFFDTHYNVIQALISGKIDVGIVRTDTLEHLSDLGIIDLQAFRVLGLKENPSFPFMSSTELYPAWTFAKAANTPESLANEMMSTFLKLSAQDDTSCEVRLKTPQDYSKIHALMKEFGIYPYEKETVTFWDALFKIRYLLLGILLTLCTSIAFMIYIQKLNRKLRRHSKQIERFNATLEKEVDERTHALTLLNTKLKELANTDELTKIDNRRHFLILAKQYFYVAKRNRSPLHMLSLDIDFFKRVNDTYGHQMGDDVLKFFTQQISGLIRESDLFGRIGGEEFAICMQNTPFEGAWALAEKIRKHIENATKNRLPHLPPITVSIGISALIEDDEEIFDLMKRADQALYQAKNNGRNQVQFV